ncbi:MAG: SDR family oxidoreductase [Clostridiales Family XIII bacterium]|jgi:NAD(P)-dependent dehydrogenase (short-subunit alcohol dehydrogenase family)|nr:SDR family oxidoreductase [Clostridiales Family XIII bacterium]
MKRFADKVALITGGGSGVGRAAAVRLAEEGARIVIADINETGSRETVEAVKKNGGEAAFVLCDVSDETQVKNAVAEAVKLFGRLDTLCNIAGFPQKSTRIEDCDVAFWEKVFAINVKGPWMLSKYALPELKKTKGTITNITSVGLHRPRPGNTVYGSSKGAVYSLTKTTAIEFAAYGIRVNCIAPGPVNTPMLPQFVADDFTEDVVKQIKGGTALDALVEPEDIAAAIAFLASDDASKITAFELYVDAGSFTGGRGKN